MTALKGKTVLITGASAGIGAAAARAFVAEGAQVGLVARNAAKCAALAEELGPQAYPLPGDVADPNTMPTAVAALIQATGRLDVLINNAGVITPIAPLDRVAHDEWGALIDINIKGVFYGIRAVLPEMKARGGGTILTIGSGAAHNPLEGWSAYCTSKAGALMLTRCLHHESAASGIRAMSLSPGTVATEMQEVIRDSGVNPVSRLDWSAHIPPEWPAKALVWMCGPEADAYLGQELSLRDEDLRRTIGVAP